MQTRKFHECNLHIEEKQKPLKQNVAFARKTAIQSYSAADHIMREHSPPLNKGKRKGKQCCATAKLPICQFANLLCNSVNSCNHGWNVSSVVKSAFPNHSLAAHTMREHRDNAAGHYCNNESVWIH